MPNLFYAEMYAELTELYIERDVRRRGLGRTLVMYAEELARERDGMYALQEALHGINNGYAEA